MNGHKRIMILPAGWEQVPLIKAAKARGLWVLAVHEDPKAEGRAHADAFEACSSRELDKLVALARKHEIDSVATDACDYSTYAAAYLSEALGFPALSLHAAVCGTNKRLQRERVRAAGLPQPEFVATHSVEEARAALERMGLPVVVKPVDNRGAFGVTVVTKPGQFHEAFLEAAANSHGREVIVERFVEGQVLTVEGFGFGKEHRSLAVSSKTMLPGRKKIALQLVYPAELPEKVRREALDLHHRVAVACGYKWGPTHGEYILDPRGGLHLVEIANRGSGVLISPVAVPALSGVDVNGLILDLADGLRPAPPKALKAPAKCVVLGFLIFPHGTPKRFDGLEKAAKLPGILSFRVWAKTGEPLPISVNAVTRHGFILAEGSDKKQALERMQAAREAVFAVYADGARAEARDPGHPVEAAH